VFALCTSEHRWASARCNNHSKRMEEKRAVLDGVAAELRRIIDEPPMKAIE
jgi:hypothetical protein